jgi:hypothetical protein
MTVLERQRHQYTSHDGTTVVVECPWGAHSGNIPPPIIEFHGSPMGPFVYQGTESALDMRDHYRGLFEEEVRVHDETKRMVRMLRWGLQQIVHGNYPASAGDAATWAQELLDNPEHVEWERMGMT